MAVPYTPDVAFFSERPASLALEDESQGLLLMPRYYMSES